MMHLSPQFGEFLRRHIFRLLFSLSAILVLFSFFDISAVAWEKIFDPVPSYQINNPSIKRSSEILEQYKTAVEEIRFRLEHEHQLYLYQFLILGGIFAVSIAKGKVFNLQESWKIADLSTNGYLSSVLGLTAIGLLVVDIHIKYNALVIGQLGEWIRVSYERGDITGWETYLSTNGPFHASPWFVLSASTLYVPTILVLLAFYLSVEHHNYKEDAAFFLLLRPVFFGVQLSLFAFVCVNNFGARPEYSAGKVVYLLFWFVLFVVITLLVYRMNLSPSCEEETA